VESYGSKTLNTQNNPAADRTQQKKNQTKNEETSTGVDICKAIPEDNAICESNNTRTTITPHPI